MFRRILVPLDGSRLAERVLPLARAFAERFEAELVLVHVLERRAKSTVHSDRHLTTEPEAEAYLASTAAQMGLSGMVSWHTHQEPVDDVARSFVEHIAEVGADLIAMTTHGTGGFSRAIFGSIAQQTLARCRIPVLLCPAGYGESGDAGRIRRVLAPVEVSPEHGHGVELSVEMAVAFSAELHLLAVVPTYANLKGQRSSAAQMLPSSTTVLLDVEAQEAGGLIDGIRQRAEGRGVRVAAEVVRGDPADVLLATIERSSPDLVVYASHGRRGIEALFDESVGAQLCKRSTAASLIQPI